MYIATRLMPALGFFFVSPARGQALGEPVLPDAGPGVPFGDIVPQRPQPESQPHSQALLAGQADTVDRTQSAKGMASACIEASIPADPAWQAGTNFDVASLRRIEAEAEAHPLDVTPEPDPGDATPRASISLRATSPELVIVPESHHESAKRIQEKITHFSRQPTKKMEDELASQIDLVKHDSTQPSLSKLTELAWRMAAYHSEVVLHPEGTRLMELRRKMLEREE